MASQEPGKRVSQGKESDHLFQMPLPGQCQVQFREEGKPKLAWREF